MARVVIAAVAGLLLLLAGIRLWFLDGLLRPVTIDGPSMAPAWCGAHYDVTCSQCRADFKCDAEHVPESGLAACFNCGFENISLETLPVQPPDRVLLDRWPLLFRAPQRHEVVACRDPEGQLTVKRVAALPGEQLRIVEGQLYDGHQPIRKTYAEAEQLRILAKVRIGQVSSFESLEVVKDFDAYNEGEVKRPLNEVRDVWLECAMEVRSEGKLLLVYTDRDATLNWYVEPANRAALLKQLRSDQEWLVVRALQHSFRRSTRLAFGSCDGQEFLTVDGRMICSWIAPPAELLQDAKARSFAIRGTGLKLQINDCRIWRDIYYLDPDGLSRPWQASARLDAKEYAVLGDNQPVSIDSRHWNPGAVKQRDMLGIVYRPFWAPRR